MDVEIDVSSSEGDAGSGSEPSRGRVSSPSSGPSSAHRDVESQLAPAFSTTCALCSYTVADPALARRVATHCSAFLAFLATVPLSPPPPPPSPAPASAPFPVGAPSVGPSTGQPTTPTARPTGPIGGAPVARTGTDAAGAAAGLGAPAARPAQPLSPAPATAGGGDAAREEPRPHATGATAPAAGDAAAAGASADAPPGLAAAALPALEFVVFFAARNAAALQDAVGGRAARRGHARSRATAQRPPGPTSPPALCARVFALGLTALARLSARPLSPAHAPILPRLVAAVNAATCPRAALAFALLFAPESSLLQLAPVLRALESLPLAPDDAAHAACLARDAARLRNAVERARFTTQPPALRASAWARPGPQGDGAPAAARPSRTTRAREGSLRHSAAVALSIASTLRCGVPSGGAAESQGAARATAQSGMHVSGMRHALVSVPEAGAWGVENGPPPLLSPDVVISAILTAQRVLCDRDFIAALPGECGTTWWRQLLGSPVPASQASGDKVHTQVVVLGGSGRGDSEPRLAREAMPGSERDSDVTSVSESAGGRLPTRAAPPLQPLLSCPVEPPPHRPASALPRRASGPGTPLRHTGAGAGAGGFSDFTPPASMRGRADGIGLQVDARSSGGDDDDGAAWSRPSRWEQGEVNRLSSTALHAVGLGRSITLATLIAHFAGTCLRSMRREFSVSFPPRLSHAYASLVRSTINARLGTLSLFENSELAALDFPSLAVASAAFDMAVFPTDLKGLPTPPSHPTSIKLRSSSRISSSDHAAWLGTMSVTASATPDASKEQKAVQELGLLLTERPAWKLLQWASQGSVSSVIAQHPDDPRFDSAPASRRSSGGRARPENTGRGIASTFDVFHSVFASLEPMPSGPKHPDSPTDAEVESQDPLERAFAQALSFAIAARRRVSLRALFVQDALTSVEPLLTTLDMSCQGDQDAGPDSVAVDNIKLYAALRLMREAPASSVPIPASRSSSPAVPSSRQHSGAAAGRRILSRLDHFELLRAIAKSRTAPEAPLAVIDIPATVFACTTASHALWDGPAFATSEAPSASEQRRASRPPPPSRPVESDTSYNPSARTVPLATRGSGRALAPGVEPATTFQSDLPRATLHVVLHAAPASSRDLGIVTRALHPSPLPAWAPSTPVGGNDLYQMLRTLRRLHRMHLEFGWTPFEWTSVTSLKRFAKLLSRNPTVGVHSADADVAPCTTDSPQTLWSLHIAFSPPESSLHIPVAISAVTPWGAAAASLRDWRSAHGTRERVSSPALPDSAMASEAYAEEAMSWLWTLYSRTHKRTRRRSRRPVRPLPSKPTSRAEKGGEPPSPAVSSSVARSTGVAFPPPQRRKRARTQAAASGPPSLARNPFPRSWMLSVRQPYSLAARRLLVCGPAVLPSSSADRLCLLIGGMSALYSTWQSATLLAVPLSSWETTKCPAEKGRSRPSVAPSKKLRRAAVGKRADIEAGIPHGRSRKGGEGRLFGRRPDSPLPVRPVSPPLPVPGGGGPTAAAAGATPPPTPPGSSSSDGDADADVETDPDVEPASAPETGKRQASQQIPPPGDSPPLLAMSMEEGDIGVDVEGDSDRSASTNTPRGSDLSAGTSSSSPDRGGRRSPGLPQEARRAPRPLARIASTVMDNSLPRTPVRKRVRGKRCPRRGSQGGPVASTYDVDSEVDDDGHLSPLSVRSVARRQQEFSDSAISHVVESFGGEGTVLVAPKPRTSRKIASNRSSRGRCRRRVRATDSPSSALQALPAALASLIKASAIALQRIVVFAQNGRPRKLLANVPTTLSAHSASLKALQHVDDREFRDLEARAHALDSVSIRSLASQQLPSPSRAGGGTGASPHGSSFIQASPSLDRCTSPPLPAHPQRSVLVPPSRPVDVGRCGGTETGGIAAPLSSSSRAGDTELAARVLYLRSALTSSHIAAIAWASRALGGLLRKQDSESTQSVRQGVASAFELWQKGVTTELALKASQQANDPDSEALLSLALLDANALSELFRVQMTIGTVLESLAQARVLLGPAQEQLLSLSLLSPLAPGHPRGETSRMHDVFWFLDARTRNQRDALCRTAAAHVHVREKRGIRAIAVSPGQLSLQRQAELLKRINIGSPRPSCFPSVFPTLVANAPALWKQSIHVSEVLVLLVVLQPRLKAVLHTNGDDALSVHCVHAFVSSLVADTLDPDSPQQQGAVFLASTLFALCLFHACTLKTRISVLSRLISLVLGSPSSNRTQGQAQPFSRPLAWARFLLVLEHILLYLHCPKAGFRACYLSLRRVLAVARTQPKQGPHVPLEHVSEVAVHFASAWQHLLPFASLSSASSPLWDCFELTPSFCESIRAGGDLTTASPAGFDASQTPESFHATYRPDQLGSVLYPGADSTAPSERLSPSLPNCSGLPQDSSPRASRPLRAPSPSSNTSSLSRERVRNSVGHDVLNSSSRTERGRTLSRRRSGRLTSGSSSAGRLSSGSAHNDSTQSRDASQSAPTSTSGNEFTVPASKRMRTGRSESEIPPRTVPIGQDAESSASGQHGRSTSLSSTPGQPVDFRRSPSAHSGLSERDLPNPSPRSPLEKPRRRKLVQRDSRAISNEPQHRGAVARQGPRGHAPSVPVGYRQRIQDLLKRRSIRLPEMRDELISLRARPESDWSPLSELALRVLETELDVSASSVAAALRSLIAPLWSESPYSLCDAGGIPAANHVYAMGQHARTPGAMLTDGATDKVQRAFATDMILRVYSLFPRFLATGEPPSSPKWTVTKSRPSDVTTDGGYTVSESEVDSAALVELSFRLGRTLQAETSLPVGAILESLGAVHSFARRISIGYPQQVEHCSVGWHREWCIAQQLPTLRWAHHEKLVQLLERTDVSAFLDRRPHTVCPLVDEETETNRLRKFALPATLCSLFASLEACFAAARKTDVRPVLEDVLSVPLVPFMLEVWQHLILATLQSSQSLFNTSTLRVAQPGDRLGDMAALQAAEAAFTLLSTKMGSELLATGVSPAALCEGSDPFLPTFVMERWVSVVICDTAFTTIRTKTDISAEYPVAPVVSMPSTGGAPGSDGRLGTSIHGVARMGLPEREVSKAFPAAFVDGSLAESWARASAKSSSFFLDPAEMEQSGSSTVSETVAKAQRQYDALLGVRYRLLSASLGVIPTEIDSVLSPEVLSQVSSHSIRMMAAENCARFLVETLRHAASTGPEFELPWNVVDALASVTLDGRLLWLRRVTEPALAELVPDPRRRAALWIRHRTLLGVAALERWVSGPSQNGRLPAPPPDRPELDCAASQERAWKLWTRVSELHLRDLLGVLAAGDNQPSGHDIDPHLSNEECAWVMVNTWCSKSCPVDSLTFIRNKQSTPELGSLPAQCLFRAVLVTNPPSFPSRVATVKQGAISALCALRKWAGPAVFHAAPATVLASTAPWKEWILFCCDAFLRDQVTPALVDSSNPSERHVSLAYAILSSAGKSLGGISSFAMLPRSTPVTDFPWAGSICKSMDSTDGNVPPSTQLFGQMLLSLTHLTGCLAENEGRPSAPPTVGRLALVTALSLLQEQTTGLLHGTQVESRRLDRSDPTAQIIPSRRVLASPRVSRESQQTAPPQARMTIDMSTSESEEEATGPFVLPPALSSDFERSDDRESDPGSRMAVSPGRAPLPGRLDAQQEWSDEDQGVGVLTLLACIVVRLHGCDKVIETTSEACGTSTSGMARRLREITHGVAREWLVVLLARKASAWFPLASTVPVLGHVEPTNVIRALCSVAVGYPCSTQSVDSACAMQAELSRVPLSAGKLLAQASQQIAAIARQTNAEMTSFPAGVPLLAIHNIHKKVASSPNFIVDASVNESGGWRARGSHAVCALANVCAMLMTAPISTNAEPSIVPWVSALQSLPQPAQQWVLGTHTHSGLSQRISPLSVLRSGSSFFVALGVACHRVPALRDWASRWWSLFWLLDGYCADNDVGSVVAVERVDDLGTNSPAELLVELDLPIHLIPHIRGLFHATVGSVTLDPSRNCDIARYRERSHAEPSASTCATALAHGSMILRMMRLAYISVAHVLRCPSSRILASYLSSLPVEVHSLRPCGLQSSSSEVFSPSHLLSPPIRGHTQIEMLQKTVFTAGGGHPSPPVGGLAGDTSAGQMNESGRPGGGQATEASTIAVASSLVEHLAAHDRDLEPIRPSEPGSRQGGANRLATYSSLLNAFLFCTNGVVYMSRISDFAETVCHVSLSERYRRVAPTRITFSVAGEGGLEVEAIDDFAVVQRNVLLLSRGRLFSGEITPDQVGAPAVQIRVAFLDSAPFPGFRGLLHVPSRGMCFAASANAVHVISFTPLRNDSSVICHVPPACMIDSVAWVTSPDPGCFPVLLLTTNERGSVQLCVFSNAGSDSRDGKAVPVSAHTVQGSPFTFGGSAKLLATPGGHPVVVDHSRLWRLVGIDRDDSGSPVSVRFNVLASAHLAEHVLPWPAGTDGVTHVGGGSVSRTLAVAFLSRNLRRPDAASLRIMHAIPGLSPSVFGGGEVNADDGIFLPPRFFSGTSPPHQSVTLWVLRGESVGCSVLSPAGSRAVVREPLATHAHRAVTAARVLGTCAQLPARWSSEDSARLVVGPIRGSGPRGNFWSEWVVSNHTDPSGPDAAVATFEVAEFDPSILVLESGHVLRIGRAKSSPLPDAPFLPGSPDAKILAPFEPVSGVPLVGPHPWESGCWLLSQSVALLIRPGVVWVLSTVHLTSLPTEIAPAISPVRGVHGRLSAVARIASSFPSRGLRTAFALAPFNEADADDPALIGVPRPFPRWTPHEVSVELVQGTDTGAEWEAIATEGTAVGEGDRLLVQDDFWIRRRVPGEVVVVGARVRIVGLPALCSVGCRLGNGPLVGIGLSGGATMLSHPREMSARSDPRLCLKFVRGYSHCPAESHSRQCQDPINVDRITLLLAPPRRPLPPMSSLSRATSLPNVHTHRARLVASEADACTLLSLQHAADGTLLQTSEPATGVSRAQSRPRTAPVFAQGLSFIYDEGPLSIDREAAVQVPGPRAAAVWRNLGTDLATHVLHTSGPAALLRVTARLLHSHRGGMLGNEEAARDPRRAAEAVVDTVLRLAGSRGEG